jgi:hypothetical protein
MTALKSDYRRLVGELAGAAHRRNADLAAAERSYLDGTAALTAALAEAAAAVDHAASRLTEAQTAVGETDRTAERLWTTLRRRPGPVPEPSTMDGSTSAASLLANVADRLEGSRTAGALSRRALWLLPPIGAGTGALVALTGAGVSAVGAGILGQLLYLAASFAGVPVAAAWARWRHGAGLDAGGVGLTVLGGMAACAFVILLP